MIKPEHQVKRMFGECLTQSLRCPGELGPQRRTTRNECCRLGRHRFESLIEFICPLPRKSGARGGNPFRHCKRHCTANVVTHAKTRRPAKIQCPSRLSATTQSECGKDLEQVVGVF